MELRTLICNKLTKKGKLINYQLFDYLEFSEFQ